jgi:hypothetical protein
MTARNITVEAAIGHPDMAAFLAAMTAVWWRPLVKRSRPL